MTNHHNDQLSDSPKDQPKDRIDKLLTDGMPKPPNHFADTVLSRIAQQTPYDYSRSPSPTPSTKTVWPSLALAASAVLGVFQVIGFIFGLWIPTVAG